MKKEIPRPYEKVLKKAARRVKCADMTVYSGVFERESLYGKVKNGRFYVFLPSRLLFSAFAPGLRGKFTEKGEKTVMSARFCRPRATEFLSFAFALLFAVTGIFIFSSDADVSVILFILAALLLIPMFVFRKKTKEKLLLFSEYTEDEND